MSAEVGASVGCPTATQRRRSRRLQHQFYLDVRASTACPPGFEFVSIEPPAASPAARQQMLMRRSCKEDVETSQMTIQNLQLRVRNLETSLVAMQ